ncbi:uncharacterized protein LOC126828156 isoform X1 [Patella vulgata]|uniref:uncharacterized protein LOC126828156 isoform X1 n=2 Tax=Patella vulgata TaxID=6465 RepID=UPI0024A7DF3C|nr:uncharacterized protein LOC126828156 isoform X1 [Patella vulgata]
MNKHVEYLINTDPLDTSIRDQSVTNASYVPSDYSDDRSYQLTESIDKQTVCTEVLPWAQQNSQEEELHHASDMLSHSLSASTVKVEISDLGGEESLNLTQSSLRKCKLQVLRPYWRLLMFIGWRGFGTETVNSGSLFWRTLNLIYPSLIVLLLIYTYIYEMVACQWKLNVQKDTRILPPLSPTIPPTTMNSTNITTLSFPIFTLRPASLVPINLTSGEACEHIITTYIIPNVLHFLAFILGIYYFRIQENEQLYALMEKVFLQATPQQNRNASQKKMIFKLRGFLISGAIWVVATMVLQAVYVWAFNFPKLDIFKTVGPGGYWTMFIIELFGRMVMNSVNLAVVVNYVTQCEMILFYVRGITLRLQEKSTEIRIAMKDILILRQSLCALNGTISKMTSLTLVIFSELTIIGISILVLNKYNNVRVWSYRGIFPVVWALMLCFPLFQAGRVNSICRRFRKIALEMRVFGYKNSSQIELDSFLTYVGHIQLKAKLFHIPIQPSYLIAIVVLTCFILLILFQTSSIGSYDYIF